MRKKTYILVVIASEARQSTATQGFANTRLPRRSGTRSSQRRLFPTIRKAVKIKSTDPCAGMTIRKKDAENIVLVKRRSGTVLRSRATVAAGEDVFQRNPPDAEAEDSLREQGAGAVGKHVEGVEGAIGHKPLVDFVAEAVE